MFYSFTNRSVVEGTDVSSVVFSFKIQLFVHREITVFIYIYVFVCLFKASISLP